MRVRSLVSKENQLTSGREYEVFGLDDRYFRILDDAAEPILYPRSAFHIVDADVSSDWVCEWGVEEDFYANPPELNAHGFYERYFDKDGDAIRTFNEYVKKMNIIPSTTETKP